MEEDVNICDFVYRWTEVMQLNHIKVQTLSLKVSTKQMPDAVYFTRNRIFSSLRVEINKQLAEDKILQRVELAATSVVARKNKAHQWVNICDVNKTFCVVSVSS